MSEQKRDELATAHEAAFEGLLAATEDLDATGWSTPTGCPGWDVHDQLAHCVGVEQYMLGDPPPQVELPDLPHVDDDFSRRTELDVEARRGVPGEDLRTEARETFARRGQALRALDPAALTEDMLAPAGVHLRGSQVLRMRLFDLASHEQDIRRALGRLDGLGGVHVPVAVEFVLRAWSRTVPRQFDGDGVLGLVIDGHGSVALDLGDGELRHDGASPDATLACTAGDLLALAGARADAPTLDVLSADGDRELVGRFREVAGITP